MSLTRFVAIDDTNSSIQYSGPWFEVNNTQTDTGIMGPPFQNTLHGVNVTANFSFLFSGSAVIVYGTSITTNVSGTQNPTWECFIDSTSIGSSPAPVDSGDYENNWILCGADFRQFEDGLHLLTVKANVSDQQTFWFDQIQYAPSANASVDQSLLRIDSSDSAIQYGSGWQLTSDDTNYAQISSTMYTRSNGSTLTYQFSGTSISMFGVEAVVIDIGITAASANYTVDDQDPVSFLVPFATEFPLQNQIFFETGQLSPGQHKLVVTYLGNVNTTSFNFNYFVQQDASSSTSSKTPTSTSVASSTSSNSLPSSSTTIYRKPTEAIIGGVIGGLVLISLLLALFFIFRRNNRRSQTLNEMSYTDPSPDVVNAFTSPSSNPNYTLLPQNKTETPNGHTLPYPPVSSKFTQRGQPSDPASTSRIPTLTPLRRQSSPTSPVIISPSSSSYVVNPFTSPTSNPNYTLLPQNKTQIDQTLPYQPISTSSKFAHRDQPSDPTSTTRIPPSSPLRQQFSPTSPLFISPSSSSSPLAVLQTSLDGPRTTVPQAEVESNEASGDRIPSAEDNVVELPPFYTIG